jgi:hypothetical protein
MAWPTKQSSGTKHNDVCTRAFANLSPLGCCPRCDELRNGSKPRAGWNDAKLAQETREREAIRRHFAPGGNADRIRAAGGMDTTFDY